MMAKYRDDLDAARLRMETLEAKLAERDAELSERKAKLRAMQKEDDEERRKIERELAAARFGVDSGETGRLNVNCMPPSDVVVAGKRIGKTPLRGHELPVGTHAVVCKHGSAGRASKSVTVEADKTTTIVLKL